MYYYITQALEVRERSNWWLIVESLDFDFIMIHVFLYVSVSFVTNIEDHAQALLAPIDMKWV